MPKCPSNGNVSKRFFKSIFFKILKEGKATVVGDRLSVLLDGRNSVEDELGNVQFGQFGNAHNVVIGLRASVSIRRDTVAHTIMGIMPGTIGAVMPSARQSFTN